MFLWLGEEGGAARGKLLSISVLEVRTLQMGGQVRLTSR